jgi:hypothetical protein
VTPEVRSTLFKLLGYLLVVAGLFLLGLSAYEMYKIGTSTASKPSADLAKRGIVAAVSGTALFLGGLGCFRLTAPGEPQAKDE